MSTSPVPVRCALIGCGDISTTHLKSYKACGIEVVALCDKDEARARKRQTEFGLTDAVLFTDYAELLRSVKVDFVTVATPVAWHAPITLAALKAGLHVACEKPSTLRLQENREIVAAAAQARRKVIFFSSRMRWGAVTLARQYIRDGDLGDLYHAKVQYYRRRGRPGVDIIPDARWFVNRELAGGGVVMDMGVYFMDMVLDLLGWPAVESVSATTFRGHAHSLPVGTRFDVEEHCTLLARAAGNLTLQFDLAWIAHQPPANVVSVMGTKGGVRIEDGKFGFYTDKGGPWQWMDTATSWQDKTPGNDHIYQDFVKAVRGEDPGVGTTPEQALAINELTQMALQSAATGREVRPVDLAGE